MAGELVKPGSLTAKALGSDRVDGFWELSFYNPGTPVWETPDGTGGWGADHSRPEFIVRAGTNVVLGTKFPEGGYGLWAIGPDGRKRWSEKRGARALAANDRHVYVLGGYYNELKYFVECLASGKANTRAPLDDSVVSLGLVLNEIEKAGGCRI